MHCGVAQDVPGERTMPEQPARGDTASGNAAEADARPRIPLMARQALGASVEAVEAAAGVVVELIKVILP
jgi:hypothetical protein